MAGQQAPEVRGPARSVGQSFAQREHTAALGPDRPAGRHVGGNVAAQRGMGGQRVQVQFRIAAGQPQRIALRQALCGQGREEGDPRTHGTQAVEVGLVDEAEGRITRHRHGAARQPGLHGFGRFRARFKVYGPVLPARALAGFGLPGQLAQRRGQQRIGGHVQALQGIVQLMRGNQAQVPLGQQRGGACALHPRQRAQPQRRLAQAGTQQVGMVGAAHAVGQQAGPAQAGPVVLQAMGQCAKGAGHARGVDHGQHRQAQPLGHIGRAGRAVEQAHDALHQDEVGLKRGGVQARTHVGLARHPQIDAVHGRAAGQLVPVRVQEVRAALEHAHAAPLARMQPRQRSRQRGLALARGRGSDQQRRAACAAPANVNIHVFVCSVRRCLEPAAPPTRRIVVRTPAVSAPCPHRARNQCLRITPRRSRRVLHMALRFCETVCRLRSNT